MTFSDSVLFAAVMTLLEEIEEEKRRITEELCSTEYYEYDMPEFPFDATLFTKRLCDIAQKLFDDADAACGTVTDVSPAELIPPMICGAIFESIDALAVQHTVKIDIYNSAAKFCEVEDVFPGELLFGGVSAELSQTVRMLTDMGFDMIHTASQKADNYDGGLGFIKAFSEFMLHLEKHLAELYPSVMLSKRPSLLAAERVLSIIKEGQRQIETANPEIKSSDQYNRAASVENEFTAALNNARTERKNGNMRRAAEYYAKAKNIRPDNWEAYFYSVFCSVYHTSTSTNPSEIQRYTDAIRGCISKAMHLAKAQLYSREELVDSIGDVAVGVAELASNYFTAAVTHYDVSRKSPWTSKAKNAQVNAIIQMLFTVGDSIEAHFSDDPEFCANVACSCWKIAFVCYDNCDMPAPQGISDYFYKIRKYIPDFQCFRSVTGENYYPSFGARGPSGSVGGCYIATAVYGSYDCPPVWTLRRFRDRYLAKSWCGRVFIRLYYALSPKLVKAFKDTKWFARICKCPLDRLVAYLMKKGYDDTVYVDR